MEFVPIIIIGGLAFAAIAAIDTPAWREEAHSATLLIGLTRRWAVPVQDASIGEQLDPVAVGISDLNTNHAAVVMPLRFGHAGRAKLLTRRADDVSVSDPKPKWLVRGSAGGGPSPTPAEPPRSRQ